MNFISKCKTVNLLMEKLYRTMMTLMMMKLMKKNMLKLLRIKTKILLKCKEEKT